MCTTLNQPKTDTNTQATTKQPWLWNVVLLNDDEHTVEYVVAMMGQLFAHPEPRGVQIAKRVDTDGRAVVLTTHKEHAEFKLDQIHAFGRDQAIAGCAGAMSAIIEPAQFSSDNDDPADKETAGGGAA